MLERSTGVLLALGFLLLTPLVGAGQEPKSPTPRQRYDALLKDYEAAEAAWKRSRAKITPADALWAKHYADDPLWTFAPRFLQFAEENRQDAVALDALLKIVEISGLGRDRFSFYSVRRAMEILIADHLQDERVLQTFLMRPSIGGPTWSRISGPCWPGAVTVMCADGRAWAW